MQTPRVAARGVAKNVNTLSTNNASVNAIDRRVNNCQQHLLISLDSKCNGMRFTADARPTTRQRELVLGYAHWVAIGVPFEPIATPDVIAWCEPPFPKRTARVHCMAKLVARLAEWAVPA